MKKNSTTGSDGFPFARGNTQYKVVRLKTGDIVLCQIEQDVTGFTFNPTITLIDPVLVLTLQMKTENLGVTDENYAIKPFLSLSNSREYPLSTETILTMGDMKPTAVIAYTNYVKKWQQRLDDEEIMLFLQAVNGVDKDGKEIPVLIIEHETPMIVERTED